MCRWISPREDWRPLQRKVPCDPQAGLGPFFHSVAGVGHPVSSARAPPPHLSHIPPSLHSNTCMSSTAHTHTHTHTHTPTLPHSHSHTQGFGSLSAWYTHTHTHTHTPTPNRHIYCRKHSFKTVESALPLCARMFVISICVGVCVFVCLFLLASVHTRVCVCMSYVSVESGLCAMCLILIAALLG